MAKKFLTHINLNKNELQNAVIQPLASAPSSPTEGQIYYNTTDDTVYVWANGAWLDLGSQGTGSGDMLASTYDPQEIEGDAFDVDNHTDGVTNKVYPAADKTKLGTVEPGADVTDATNVDAAGAVMNTDTSTASMQFVVDEDNMASNSATKVPTQQSAKAYVDASIAALADSAPELLNTLNEIAAALGDDPNFATTITDLISAIDTRVDETEADLVGVTRKYAASIGDGAETTYVVTHNLGNKDVVVQLRQNSDDAFVEADVVSTSTTQVTITFAVAPTSNAIRVVVIG